jgi:succinate dehydrogenase/fumarate reductase-like Fe-S protein
MTKNFINISKNLIYKNYVKILFLLRKKNKMSQESLSQKFLKIKDSKLSPEEAYKILKDFNPDIHNNVDVINKPEPGQIYIFFTKDKNMYEDWRSCIECTNCNYWYHYICEKLNDIDELDEKWLCSRCHYA